MEDLFLSVLNMSLTASYVIAAVMLARLFLKKAPKVISYALWAVAGFRLVFPFSFESVFSLIPFKSAPIPMDIATQPIPHVDSGIRIVDNVVSSVLPAAMPAASVNPMQVWLTIGAYLWLVGIAVMLIYSVVSIVLLKRRLNGAKLIEDNIYRANNLRIPFVLGLFRPKIYIPAGLTEEENRYIILHERTHIRRHDHVVKFLAYFILCLHWFNPFAWAAFLLMSTDMEMSCDERVLKEIGVETKKAYSMSLLSLAAERRIIGGSRLAFGEGGMKERIKNVLNFKKPSRVIIVAAVALVAILSVGFAINRVTAVTGDYDFYNFSVNGFMLGADTNEMDTSALTPTEPLHVSDGYDFNYEEVRYSTDANTRRLIKMLVNVYDGAYIPSVTIHKAEGPIYIPHNLNTIEQVIDVFGQGAGGWQDREQRLRYMEYHQEEGRLSATVRFVYTDGESAGINHRLVWVMAESSLPYPSLAEVLPTDDKIISVQEDDFDGDGKSEAFVMTGKGSLNEGGDLWFVSKGEVIKLNDRYLYSAPEIIQISDKKFIKYEENYATGRPLFLLGVENGKPKSVISGGAQNLEQMPDGTFTVLQNTLDMMSDGTGRTVKSYWLYYSNGLHEYGAIEITQSQFLEFAGADDVLKQIKADGGTIKNILYRDNHIININYKTPEGMNRYVNLKYDDKSVSKLHTKEESGVYLTALLPDIATYPAGFRHLNRD